MCDAGVSCSAYRDDEIFCTLSIVPVNVGSRYLIKDLYIY